MSRLTIRNPVPLSKPDGGEHALNDSEGKPVPKDAVRPQRAASGNEPADSRSAQVGVRPEAADSQLQRAASGNEPADSRPQRADARRNKEALLDAAAAIFVEAGVEAPVRDIAARAGVGTGTIYRHFPTRADLIIAVYRHQVEACAEAGPALLASGMSPYAALGRWIDLFADFLVTKHGLAHAMRSDQAGFAALHAYFLGRLEPVGAQLVAAAVEVGEIRSGISAHQLMHGVGNLCVVADNDRGYDARRLVEVLVAGLRRVD
jgi:AcrR family transcriptional regulator